MVPHIIYSHALLGDPNHNVLVSGLRKREEGLDLGSKLTRGNKKLGGGRISQGVGDKSQGEVRLGVG